MNRKKQRSKLDALASKIIKWVGTTTSLIVHTLLFVGAFVLILAGADSEKVMLTLTTVVSLEAIYLALFIQITVNKQHYHIKEVREDIEDIQENLEELTEEDKEAV